MVLKLESICPRPEVRRRLAAFVRERTIIGFEAAKLLTLFVLNALESQLPTGMASELRAACDLSTSQPTSWRAPSTVMFPITQTLVSRALKLVSLDGGKANDPKKMHEGAKKKQPTQTKKETNKKTKTESKRASGQVRRLYPKA